MNPMKRYIVFMLICLCSMSGCTFQDGQPWGEVQSTLKINLAPRLNDMMYWQTAQDTSFELTNFSMEVGAIRYLLIDESEAIAFDPANPPPAYSLCHNGHCHHEDGRLVDYEDIQRELVQTTNQNTVIQPFENVAKIKPGDNSIESKPCPNRCTLTQGILVALELDIIQINIEGKIHQLSGQEVTSYPFSATWTPKTTPSKIINLPIDDEQDVNLQLAVELNILPNTFDDIKFEQFSPETSLQLGLQETFTSLIEARLFNTKDSLTVKKESK